VVGNLEGPIVEKHVRTPSLAFKFNFASSIGSLLARHNIRVVSLANNHTYDFGQDGYDYTAQVLTDAGVAAFGHPFSSSGAYILRKTIEGRKFIFAGFNATNPNFDYTAATRLIASTSKASDETFIVQVHGGIEYELRSSASQQKFYRGLIDAGADSVISHHPHVVQEIESYKNKLIFYSLGNFIFDQYFSGDVQEGLLVKAVFSDAGIRYELMPMRGYERSQPTVMTETDMRQFLKKLSAKSSKSLSVAIENGSIVISN
jgi:gamma-polyglutamate biosynthesis protein CapA